ncbi:MAG: TIM barrel protein [Planctomycetota bacterium]|jgi:sugar phosphate isomerase/epimerase
MPRIHLAVDNCVCKKRWTAPAAWAALIADLGVQVIEASADTECDPLYGGAAYLADWVKDVGAACDQSGTRVSNLYSGHGTYATLGLAHNDARVADRILEEWLKPMVAAAGQLDAGLGFFCHAFDDAVLQDPLRYAAALDALVDRLADLAAYAATVCRHPISVEQMYSPHQVPWTHDGCVQLLRSIYGRAGAPLYVTLDTGHASGQARFLRPDSAMIGDYMAAARAGEQTTGMWLGPQAAYEAFARSLADGTGDPMPVLAAMDGYDYLFAKAEDCSPYRWLERLGRYAPIIHLQQTDGHSSSHWPFTRARNEVGIIDGPRLLASLAASYQAADDPALPPPVTDIYLTLELFAGTAAINADIVAELRESVAYWRCYVPQDGLELSELLDRVGGAW